MLTVTGFPSCVQFKPSGDRKAVMTLPERVSFTQYGAPAPDALATVTVAVPTTLPLVAVTVSVGVPLAGAVYNPPLVIVPAAPVLLTDHAKPGCGDIEFAN